MNNITRTCFFADPCGWTCRHKLWNPLPWRTTIEPLWISWSCQVAQRITLPMVILGREAISPNVPLDHLTQKLNLDPNTPPLEHFPNSSDSQWRFRNALYGRQCAPPLPDNAKSSRNHCKQDSPTFLSKRLPVQAGRSAMFDLQTFRLIDGSQWTPNWLHV